MSLKNRRFSLDSFVSLEGTLGGKRAGDRLSSKKSSLDDAQLEIHELNQSLNSNTFLSKQTIAEENLERSDGLISNSSFVKHNKRFHKLFPEIPDENLKQAFTCSLQKEVLYHGKLFVSENHLCFHSSVLLKDTKVVIPAASVREVKKQYLSMVSVQTAEEEKHTFVSLRRREICYELIQTICSNAQGESADSSPRLSSAENEADQDEASSFSNLEDDCDPSQQGGVHLPCSFPHTSQESPRHPSSSQQSSFTDEDDSAFSWIWEIFERVLPFFLLRQVRNFSAFFYFHMVLMVLLLLTSAFIGLRIIALHKQLESLGALNELSLHYKESTEEEAGQVLMRCLNKALCGKFHG